MRVLVSLVCVCALLGVVHIAAPIIIPLLLALTLATAFQPISHQIARRGWPPAIAAACSIVVVLIVVGGVGIVMYIAASDLVASLPQYAAQLQALQERLAHWLQGQSMMSAAQSVRTYDVAAPLSRLAQSSLLGIGNYVQMLFFVLVMTSFIGISRHSWSCSRCSCGASYSVR
jgi:predicted PurR-regulated permease PerM